MVAFVDQLKTVRVALFRADVLRSLAFVAAGALLILLFGRGKVGAGVLTGGLGALILIDGWAVDKRYLHNGKERGQFVQWVDQAKYDRPHSPNAADRAILELEWSPAAETAHLAAIQRLKAERNTTRIPAEEELAMRFSSLRRHAGYRVLDIGNPFNDARTSYYHRSIGGYHGAKLKRYQELIEFHIAPQVQAVVGVLRTDPGMVALDSALARQGVLNMLNTRYLTYSPDQPPLNNPFAYGDAWFVDELRWVPDADTEIAELGRIDPRRTAVVDERYRAAVGDARVAPDSTATVELTHYATNALTYRVRSAQGGMVVFSEIWYGPDWQAYIDDRPVEHFRANYVLRGITVPPGEHTVVFRVESRPFNGSRPIAMASSALVLLLLVAALGMAVRDERRAR